MKDGNDPLLKYPAYVKALELFDNAFKDTEILLNDIRGREITRQIIRSSGSISANFEEGYGRGTTKEFIHHLRIANGEARETKGWYYKSRLFLPEELINKRMNEVDEIIALIRSMIKTLGLKA
ncbi:MAG: four helix bundle protein [Planctomycetes bacterium]|nr:four helix bundle protein [Planctomycetota bacterium]